MITITIELTENVDPSALAAKLKSALEGEDFSITIEQGHAETLRLLETAQAVAESRGDVLWAVYRSLKGDHTLLRKYAE